MVCKEKIFSSHDGHTYIHVRVTGFWERDQKEQGLFIQSMGYIHPFSEQDILLLWWRFSMLNTVQETQTFSCKAERKVFKSINILKKQKRKSNISRLYFFNMLMMALQDFCSFFLIIIFIFLFFLSATGSLTFFHFLHVSYVPWNQWVWPKSWRRMFLLQDHLLMSMPNVTSVWSPLHYHPSSAWFPLKCDKEGTTACSSRNPDPGAQYWGHGYLQFRHSQ